MAPALPVWAEAPPRQMGPHLVAATSRVLRSGPTVVVNESMIVDLRPLSLGLTATYSP
jgi:hypothetical protein